MRKTKLQRMGKEELARRVKAKQRKRFFLKIQTGIYKCSLYLNLMLTLVIAHYHNLLIPFLTNTYEKIAPILESLIKQLPF